MYIPADPRKCPIEGNLRQAETDKPYTLTVNLVDSDGKKCLKRTQKTKAEPRSIRDDTTVEGTIKHLSPETIVITFKSLRRGRNELSVTM